MLEAEKIQAVRGIMSTFGMSAQSSLDYINSLDKMSEADLKSQLLVQRYMLNALVGSAKEDDLGYVAFSMLQRIGEQLASDTPCDKDNMDASKRIFEVYDKLKALTNK